VGAALTSELVDSGLVREQLAEAIETSTSTVVKGRRVNSKTYNGQKIQGIRVRYISLSNPKS
jgi:hypothetical protein